MFAMRGSLARGGAEGRGEGYRSAKPLSRQRVGDGSIVQVGITDYAQGELGDVVYVELPKVGAAFSRMDVFGNIEAVKAVSELYAPVAGTVTEVNTALEGDPALVNRDPYGAGWMIKLRVKNAAEL